MKQQAYTNSDENLQDATLREATLREAILAAFAADSRTVRADLRVGVMNSIAHLGGKVDSLVTRRAAEEIASRLEGVRGVVNRIEAPGAPSPARPINLDLEDLK